MKPSAEVLAALGATVLAATWLVLAAINVGPLWRDEVNTINIAQMSSLQDLWRNMSFESFPPLWPLLVRGCSALGLAGSDVSIRIFGLYVGLLFLGCLWLCARWLGCRAPSLSLGLLGSLPAFIFIMGSNRAYGLASCLLILSFGTLWRLVELPSRGRILAAGVCCLLFAQCVYYDALFLAAMLAGAALVTLRRRAWKTLAALVAIGAVSAGSLMFYLPIIQRGSIYVPLMRWPYFDVRTMWERLNDAFAYHSSAEIVAGGRGLWIWIALMSLGVAAAVVIQWQQPRPTVGVGTGDEIRRRADLAWFCATSMVLGAAGLLVFLFRLQYWTQTWYYVELACLCAISIDGLLGANWPALRPWGLARIAGMAAVLAIGAKAAWNESHTRRTDVDLIATALNKYAAAGDLIVVNGAFEGIAFNRYYHGAARWVTVPPVDSHWVHRNDLVLDKMHDPEAMTPMLCDLTNTLQNGHSIWFAGNMTARSPEPPGPDAPRQWVGTFLLYWTAQASSVLLQHAREEQIFDVAPGQPICCLENLPLIRFAGYKDANEPTNAPAARN